ncbi:MAG: uroporphyrinogen-III C-methyltransferase [Lachnospiraceae bacterium]
MSRVVLVGAGPGDVDLLTLKGKEYINKADCIVYDRLASKDILNYAKSDCEFIFVGKENHKHVMKQEDINRLLLQKSLQHNLVVRLKGGDPYIFGRGGEEALFLKEQGVNVEIVPGVTSVSSVLAYAGIPITHRDYAKGFQVITAHSKKDEPSEIDYSQLSDTQVTLVFLMGLAHVGQIAEGLILAGRDPSTPVAVISNGTTAYQKKCIGTLENISELVERAGLLSPAIIVVGNVVRLASRLCFFENQPLFGKTVLVPYIENCSYQYGTGEISYAENRLVTLLRDQGAKTVEVKVGKIIPREVSLTGEYLAQQNWIIFTGSNGVYSFMYNLEKCGLDVRSIANASIAVVGRKTAEVLKKFVIKADYISKGQTASSLAEEIEPLICKDDRVLHVCAGTGSHDLEVRLSDKCAFSKTVFYDNIETEFEDIVIEADYICFTSASNVDRMKNRMIMEKKSKIVTIGPVSTKAAMQSGYQNILQAEDASYEGIVKTILRDRKRNGFS